MSSDNKEKTPQDFDYWSSRKKEDEKRDWPYEKKNWLDDYTESVKHPHRAMITEVMSSWEAKHGIALESVLEIGCNTGPNLALIKRNFPDVHVTGIDANPFAIEIAKKNIDGIFFVNDLTKVGQFAPKFDVVICDAVLMYIKPKEIDEVIDMLSMNCTKILILFEWNALSYYGAIKDYHWARDYKEHLIKRGFNVVKKKLTKKEWQSKNWQKNGYFFVGFRLQSPTLEKKS